MSHPTRQDFSVLLWTVLRRLRAIPPCCFSLLSFQFGFWTVNQYPRHVKQQIIVWTDHSRWELIWFTRWNVEVDVLCCILFGSSKRNGCIDENPKRSKTRARRCPYFSVFSSSVLLIYTTPTINNSSMKKRNHLLREGWRNRCDSSVICHWSREKKGSPWRMNLHVFLSGRYSFSQWQQVWVQEASAVISTIDLVRTGPFDDDQKRDM